MLETCNLNKRSRAASRSRAVKRSKAMAGGCKKPDKVERERESTASVFSVCVYTEEQRQRCRKGVTDYIQSSSELIARKSYQSQSLD